MVHKTKLIISMVFVLTGVITGCQKNPYEIPSEKSETYDMSVPSYIEKEIQISDGIVVDLSGDIIRMDQPLMSGKFIRAQYEQSRVARVYDALCGDSVGYQFSETKDELLTYVAYASIAYDQVFDEEKKSHIALEIKELEQIRKLAESAPTEKQVAELSNIREYTSGIIQVDMGKNRPACFQVLEEPYHLILYSNYGFPLIDRERNGSEYQISADLALLESEKILESIGIDNDFGLTRIEEVFIDEAYYQMFFDKEFKTHAYKMLYTRKVNGLNQLDDDRVVLGTRNSYNVDYLQEYIEIIVDSEGIMLFKWQSPGEIVLDQVHTKAVSFEDVLSKAETRIRESYNKYTFPDVASENVRIHINRIEQGYICHMGKNGEELVVPVWEFFGYIENTIAKDKKFYNLELGVWNDSYKDNTSLCVINALNGNYINRIGAVE